MTHWTSLLYCNLWQHRYLSWIWIMNLSISTRVLYKPLRNIVWEVLDHITCGWEESFSPDHLRFWLEWACVLPEYRAIARRLVLSRVSQYMRVARWGLWQLETSGQSPPFQITVMFSVLFHTMLYKQNHFLCVSWCKNGMQTPLDNIFFTSKGACC